VVSRADPRPAWQSERRGPIDRETYTDRATKARMAIRNWLLGSLLVVLAFVGLVYGLAVLRELLVRGVILVALLAVAVLVPLAVFRYM